ncbi:hypothetical protein Q7P35_010973 [Cladosporium inversicolor]
MFAKAARRHRDSTSSRPATADTPVSLVSPLGERFDLARDSQHSQQQQLHSPISLVSRPSAESVRRRTGDGQRQSIVSLQPPVLPPIPRVASRYESEASLAVKKEQRAKAREQEQVEHTALRLLEGQESTVAPTTKEDPSVTSSAAPQAPPLSPLEISRSANSDHYPEISFDEPRMEATMFPRPEPQSNVSNGPYTSGSPMSRSFIDSRDRPYSHNVQRPPAVASSHSSPNALPPRSNTVQGLYPPGPSNTSSPAQPAVAGFENALKTSSTSGTNYSGSTARPSIHSSKSASASPLQTIGTPYSETSTSYPAPQHVMTRPKTMGSSSTIAGVMVPTHHTNGLRKEQGKSEKRKTRSLLNPMALLVRRRSGQDTVVVPNEADRRAHAQAQARQKSLATAGVSTIPEDFDPRIRGKIVHDFNAPRTRRTFSSGDVNFDGPGERQLQSADSMPAMPSSADQNQDRPSLHSAHLSDVSSRHSRHTPIFIEHLSEEPNGGGYLNAVQAERLENKEFLKRASHQRSPSQESSLLPPFARRSQQLDPMQASFYCDDDSSKRSSEQSSYGKRESNVSSGVDLSPIAARGNSSPISPEAVVEKNRRPMSDISMLGGKYDAPSNIQYYNTHMGTGEVRRGPASPTSHPGAEAYNSSTSPAPQFGQFQTSSTPAMKDVHPALRNLVSGPNSPKPAYPDGTSARSSPALGSSVPSTPEPVVAQAAISFQSPSSPPKLVEKLASAVGHSKILSSSTPKHAASNASRFSFQLDGSAAEERALEEKHRRVASTQPSRKKSTVEEDPEDEDDYFDEDAMDDEDEMEAENRMHDSMGSNVNAHSFGSNAPMYHHQPNHQMPRSDASSIYDEDTTAAPRPREPTYAEHPAFRGHSAVYSTKHNSMAPSSHYSTDMSTGNNEGWTPHHNRFMSDATIMTLADSENGGNGPGASGSNFYMQPQAAGYENRAGIHTADKHDLNREETSANPIVQNNAATRQLVSNTGALQGTQLSPRFGDFRFSDSPERSRPATSQDFRLTNATTTGGSSMASPNGAPQAPVTSPLILPSSTSYAYGTDEKPQSAAYHGSIGKGIRARNVSMNQNLQYAAPSESGTESVNDEMYFDDGGFSEDVQNSSGYGESINEDQFDNPDFAGGFKGMEPRGYHERHASAMTITSRDGPYPTFAMPNNAGKAQLRQSQLLLDDLPLQGPGGTQWAPKPTSSEDAKRLGLSDMVPPLPAPAGSQAAASQMEAYHQALADAAIRAAKDGRFERHGSVSSDRSSVYSNKDDQAKADRDSASYDDTSRYSRDTDANQFQPPATNVDAEKSQGVAENHQPNSRYTLPRMSGFDFGFNFDDALASNDVSAPTQNFMYNAAPSDDINAAPSDDFMTSHLEDGYEDEDDDFIAAANAEALAYDDSGFYGQEFGFYARARSDSTGSNKGQTIEAINGGFFGDDGDDPLRRQKSSREPDLTPITERSEFSARNSFINFGPASAGWGHGGVASPALARLPLSPLVSGADGPNKARASGGGYFGVFPAGGPPQVQTHQQFVGASPASATNSPARPWTSDSPVSATSASSRGAPFMSASASGSALGVDTASDPDATPRKPQAQGHMSSPLNDTPGTAKKIPLPAVNTHVISNGNLPTHSRNHSGADSVAYVRETVSPGEESSGPPRWVLERRRTSELGVDQIVGREIVKGGWI